MTTEPWQATEQQAKEAGQVVLETKASVRCVLATGVVDFLKACGVKVDDAAHAKLVQLLEEIGAP